VFQNKRNIWNLVIFWWCPWQIQEPEAKISFCWK